MADAPPTSRMALCVGKYATPTTALTSVTQDGTWKNMKLLDLSTVSGGYELYKWLWEPLGVSRDDWRTGVPGKWPLAQETQAGISAARA